MFNRFAIILTPILLLGVWLERQTFPSPEDSAPYHERVRAEVEAIPHIAGTWEGVDIDVPKPAQKLLRPNAVLARQYRNRESGDIAALILVHCADTRDLAGHYPPVCYPAQGWIDRGCREVTVTFGGRDVVLSRYVFSRSMLDREATLVVYDFFVIPGKGPVPDMESVGRAAADYLVRPFGAAQVQVVMHDVLPDDHERRIAAEILEPASAAIRAIEQGTGVNAP
jgi:hypothetical protein